MKLFSEKMCEMYNDKIASPMKTLVVRPGNLYGPYDKFKWSESKVIAALIRKGIENRIPFEVWGDGNDIKDFLYIDDFIEALLLSFIDDKISGPINIASGIPVTVKNVVNHVCQILSIDKNTIEFRADKPTMIPKRLINIERITSLTGWRPKICLSEGISKTIMWYKEFYQDFDPESENAYL